jgi:hypothetical protein
MKVTSTLQHQTELQTRRNPTVAKTIEIQTPATYLSISQESAILYAKHIEQITTKVAQLQMQDMESMKRVQGNGFYANPYAKYLDERVHVLRYFK